MTADEVRKAYEQINGLRSGRLTAVGRYKEPRWGFFAHVGATLAGMSLHDEFERQINEREAALIERQINVSSHELSRP